RAAGDTYADYRFPFPLVAPFSAGAVLEAHDLSARRSQYQGRLQLSAAGARRLRTLELGRMVRPRQAARAHGRARPPGRRGVLDRTVFGVLLRPAPRGGPRSRDPLERGDGGRAKEVSRPGVGERRGAARRYQDRDRGPGRRGEPPGPDG